MAARAVELCFAFSHEVNYFEDESCFHEDGNPFTLR